MANRRPRAPKRRPRSAQERPRAPKRRPRDAPEGRETVDLLKNRSCQGPERILDAFESVQGARCGPILEKSVLQPLRDQVLFSMIVKSANLAFYRPHRGFTRFFKNARCSTDVGATRETSIEKYSSEASKSLFGFPATLQNRARSVLGHPQIDWDGQAWLDCLGKWPVKWFWSRAPGSKWRSGGRVRSDKRKT